MDMLDNFGKGKGKDKDPPDLDSGDKSDENNVQPTKSDLIHSAQVLADVAKSQLRHEPGKYDQGEVAAATADLLNAAAEYGVIDETKGVGKYLDKAEDYLRQYQTTSHPVDQMKSSPSDDSGGDKN